MKAGVSREIELGYVFMVNSLPITNIVVYDELDEESRIPRINPPW